MPPKRKRHASPTEKTKRSTSFDDRLSPWSWVGTEVKDVSALATEHVLATCGFSSRNSYPFCSNRFAQNHPSDKLETDMIVITDDEISQCSKKVCKHNPNCLNYLGQEKWEDDAKASAIFVKNAELGYDPDEDSREPDQPVGLKNLGATCYANASLQVWFRDLPFRAGVYGLQPSSCETNFVDSPIFHLQVTFAAMQEGRQKVYNPSKLVESLELRAGEQQDAQEFAKLFMSHLDAEFQRQPVVSLRSLVTDQFQGKQLHGTICEACKRQSEHETDFLELEINLTGNIALTDGLANSLKPEKLSGENRYHCSYCDTLQDATRYTKLRRLPPVLHFSLMRFVYDLNTMERKKSKSLISFPTTIDMRKYIDSDNADQGTNHIYDLRGVLLHKGPSAYHGHYEAQVFDETLHCWFQFNDESVTKIKTLGDRIFTKKKEGGDAEQDEAPEVTMEHNDSSIIRSKDAYMLIYSRRTPQNHGAKSTESVPAPPPWAMKTIESLNQAHFQACEEFLTKKTSMIHHFETVRRNVRSICHSWNLTSENEKSVVVSHQVLSDWLSDHCVTLACQQSNSQIPNEDKDQCSVNDTAIIKNDDIRCPHGKLDPEKAAEMKRISETAHVDIINLTRCIFDPVLSPQEVCRSCVESQFKERLYQLEHPRLVSEFDHAAILRNENVGYWISKKWLRDWRSAKPRMHVTFEGDPDPEAGEFRRHVRCEHGALSINTLNRCQISKEGVVFLNRLFPNWNPPSAEEEPCGACTIESYASKEDRKESRKRAEDEKAHLYSLYDSTTDGDGYVQTGPCAVLSSAFVTTWKQWANFPSDNPRPDIVDNSRFFCEHEMLVFDPNCVSDQDSSMMIVQRHVWDALESYYTCGPLISLTKTTQEDGSSHYDQAISTCRECRLKKKTNWTTAEIVIQLFNPKEQSETTTKSKLLKPARQNFRQSRRLRRMKQHGVRRRMTVSKDTTIKDIKIKIQEEWNISTICQRLIHHGTELQNNAATVASLEIGANDLIELHEVNEVHDLDSDTDDTSGNRNEGAGFSGTILCGVSDRTTTTIPSSPNNPAYRACPSCTLHNSPEATACTICDTPLGDP